MKKSSILKLGVACSLMMTPVLFASESVTEVYNKDGIVVNLKGDEKGKFKVSVKNQSKKDMFGVKIVSEEIKGLKLIKGKELFLGDIKAGEEKVLEEKEIKYEIIKAIENQKLVKTSIQGVYKLYIPLTIAGLTGMIYLLVSDKKKSKKMMSLILATGMLGASFIGVTNAKESYSRKEKLEGKVVVEGKEYNYTGLMMWNEEKMKDDSQNPQKEPNQNSTETPEVPNEPSKPDVPSVDENLEKIKENAKKEISKLNNLTDEDKNYFEEKIKNAKNESEIKNILDEAKSKDKEQNKEDKVVVFEDATLKEIILNLFKNNVGYDGLDDTVLGEYEFKLSDPNYKLPQDATEIHESDMEKIEALALRGFTMNEDFDVIPYEIKNLKGLESAKNLKQLTISSGIIPQEGDEDFVNGIEYSKGSFSNVEPLSNLKKLEILRLSHNNIENVSPLKDLTNLKQLYISHNRIKDISDLENLTNLENFDFSKNEVSNMDVVKNFKNLKMLDLVRNKVSDISAVENLVNIDYLDITNNGVEDINSLKNLNELTTFKAENNKIENVEVLNGKSKLSVLYLSKNKLTDKSFGNIHFDNLTEFLIHSNELEDISFVEKCTKLVNLDVKNNKIKNLPDLSKLTALTSVDIKNNNIKDFSQLIGKNFSRLEFYNQTIDLNNENPISVKDETFEISSPFVAIENFTKNDFDKNPIEISVLSDNENISVEFKSGKLVFNLNEKAMQDLKQGELNLQLTYSFEHNFGEHTVTVKNLKLKMEKTKEFVEIEDALLLKVINKNIDKNRIGDEKVTKEEMENLKELSIFLNEDGTAHFSETGNTTGTEKGILEVKDLKNTADFKFAVTRGIKSIKGLEYAKNLEKLKLNENEISDLTPLENLKNLKYLELQRNRIVDLKPLSGLVNLEYLKLYNNLIEDVRPLEKLVNLTSLDLHYNVTVEGNESNKKISKGITDISTVIDNMKKLMFLDVSANRISNVKGLEKLDKISNLDLSGNGIHDYENLDEYIVDRIVKMYDDENPQGSIKFDSQVVNFDNEIEVKTKEIEIESPFKGIRELSNKFGEVYEDENFNLFDTVESSVDGISATYNKDTNKIKLKFSDKLLKENNTKTVKLDLKLQGAGMFEWTIKNINLKINLEDDKDIVSENYRDFYVDLFNKYSNFDKKYKNLTDEANLKFKQGNLPKKDKLFTKEDMQMLKSITITDKNVTDEMLKPLKYAINLEEIKIELKDKNLTREVTDFSFLKNLPKLKVFYYLNQDPDFTARESLAKIDFSNNKNLKDVRIVKTDLTDLSFLKNLNLETLSLQDNNIENISEILSMDNLTRLDLDNNKISKLGDFKNLQNLITLYLRDNPVEDISTLENLQNLEALHLRNTNVKDISVLKKLSKLHRLYIDKMKNINTDYFSVVKELNEMNTLLVGKITVDDFEWLKNFSIRDEIDATYGEDKIRLFSFTDLEIPIEIKKSQVKNGKISIINPLKNYDGDFLVFNDDPDMSDVKEKPDNLSFNADKIEIENIVGDEFDISYEIGIVDYSSGKTFGDYGGQPAEISGKVTLKIKIVE